MITPAQARAARGALRWRVQDVADAANVGHATVTRFEAERSTPIPITLAAIQKAFEGAGVEFMDGGWVRLRPDKAA